jgi:hypothetical protein
MLLCVRGEACVKVKRINIMFDRPCLGALGRPNFPGDLGNVFGLVDVRSL